MRLISTGSLAAVLAVAMLALPQVLRAQGGMTLKTEAFQEVTVKSKSGKTEKKTVPAAKVVPGSEVIYVISYVNGGSKPAEQVVIANPLPKELTYKNGSGEGKGSKFEVSVDGGKTYGVLVSLTVPGEDGKPRPATAADITHLRWTLGGAVAPGKGGSVSYRAVLK